MGPSQEAAQYFDLLTFVSSQLNTLSGVCGHLSCCRLALTDPTEHARDRKDVQVHFFTEEEVCILIQTVVLHT